MRPWKDFIQYSGKDQLTINGIQCPECDGHIQGNGKGQRCYQIVLETTYPRQLLATGHSIAAHKIITQRNTEIDGLQDLQQDLTSSLSSFNESLSLSI